MKVRRKTTRQPRVEMLPLIDIVFLLLIFFIYAMLSMAVHRGLNLDLPESSSARLTQDDVLSISVQKKSSAPGGLLLQLNDTPVPLDRLADALQSRVVQENTSKALIFAEETLSYQQLFQVLDQVQAGGIEEISLQANGMTE